MPGEKEKILISIPKKRALQLRMIRARTKRSISSQIEDALRLGGDTNGEAKS